MSAAGLVSRGKLTAALVGNPNSGKTTIFNALTGLRQKTANYPGVTVEKKEGLISLPAAQQSLAAIDLPGAYSLLTRSPDEEVVHGVLSGRQAGTAAPDILIMIVDATNLERNLFFVTQLLETGIPSVLVLNMWDLVKKAGTEIDVDRLSKELSIPVVTAVGSHRKGVEALRDTLGKLVLQATSRKTSAFQVKIPVFVENELEGICDLLQKRDAFPPHILRGEALRLLGSTRFQAAIFGEIPGLKEAVLAARERLLVQGIDGTSVEAETRYAFVQELCRLVVRRPAAVSASLSERLDRIFTHKVWGFLVFFGLMAVVFQSVFTWATVPMELLGTLVDGLGGWVGGLLPPGPLESLVVDGMIAGVGGVVVFLPQILFLFFFIAILEDSGYMARAAFVLDRVMRKVGLNGKSFIPLLSSFACAVPAIMSTRTIEDRNDRFATIMVAPLMSCSARLPVYTLMISAFIPPVTVLGFFNLKGVTLLAMYGLSITAGLTVAAIFRKTLLKGSRTPFVLELPPYRIPNMRTVFMTMWDRAMLFLRKAGTIIFSLSILLWFLASYPKNPATEHRYRQLEQAASESYSGDALETRLEELHALQKGDQIRESFAGMMGHWIEPVIRPLGYDWKIGIGLIASFAAREVLVSTLSIVYSVTESGDTHGRLIERLQSEKSPVTGKPVYTPLVAVSVMVFFVLACQCMSTVAIVRRETNTWRWPLFMIFYMTTLAWAGAFLVYQTGTWLHL